MRRTYSQSRTYSQKRALNRHLASVASRSFIPTDPDRVHEQVLVCARLSRVLHDTLSGLDWPQVRFSDRTRLKRSLTLLAGDIPLVWLIAGQPLDAKQGQFRSENTQEK